VRAAAVYLDAHLLEAVTLNRYPAWSVSADMGATWSQPEPLRDRDGGTILEHPLSPCPIYPLSDGTFIFLFHNHPGLEEEPEEGLPRGIERTPLCLARGRFQPKAHQPVWFSPPTLLMDTDRVGIGYQEGRSDLAMYASIAHRGGKGVFWYPDRKFYLLGKEIAPSILWCSGCGAHREQAADGDPIIGTAVRPPASRRCGHAGFSGPAPLCPASTRVSSGLPACGQWSRSASRRGQLSSLMQSAPNLPSQPRDPPLPSRSNLDHHRRNQRARLQDIQARVIHPEASVEGVSAAVRNLLSSKLPPTAIVVFRVPHLFTVLTQVMHSGYRIPSDVSLICLSYDPFLENLVPSVAHYACTPGVYTRRLAQMISQLVSGHMLLAEQRFILPSYQRGESVGPCRDG
jgi:hypothetical protein